MNTAHWRVSAVAGPSRLARVRCATRRPGARALTTIGIRKEDPKRLWERRAPLTPEAVEGLIAGQQRGGKTGDGAVQVEVESCARRCFSNADYKHVSYTLRAKHASTRSVVGVRSSHTGWRNSGAFPDGQGGPGTRHQGATRSARTRAARSGAGA